MSSSGMCLSIDPEILRPLITAVVVETLDRLGAGSGGADGRLGYSESEAAEMCGVPRHVLRDARHRGEIRAARVGRRVRYTRESIAGFLGGRGR